MVPYKKDPNKEDALKKLKFLVPGLTKTMSKEFEEEINSIPEYIKNHCEMIMHGIINIGGLQKKKTRRTKEGTVLTTVVPTPEEEFETEMDALMKKIESGELKGDEIIAENIVNVMYSSLVGAESPKRILEITFNYVTKKNNPNLTNLFTGSVYKIFFEKVIVAEYYKYPRIYNQKYLGCYEIFDGIIKANTDIEFKKEDAWQFLEFKKEYAWQFYRVTSKWIKDVKLDITDYLERVEKYLLSFERPVSEIEQINEIISFIRKQEDENIGENLVQDKSPALNKDAIIPSKNDVIKKSGTSKTSADPDSVAGTKTAVKSLEISVRAILKEAEPLKGDELVEKIYSALDILELFKTEGKVGETADATTKRIKEIYIKPLIENPQDSEVFAESIKGLFDLAENTLKQPERKELVGLILEYLTEKANRKNLLDAFNTIHEKFSKYPKVKGNPVIDAKDLEPFLKQGSFLGVLDALSQIFTLKYLIPKGFNPDIARTIAVLIKVQLFDKFNTSIEDYLNKLSVEKLSSLGLQRFNGKFIVSVVPGDLLEGYLVRVRDDAPNQLKIEIAESVFIFGIKRAPAEAQEMLLEIVADYALAKYENDIKHPGTAFLTFSEFASNHPKYKEYAENNFSDEIIKSLDNVIKPLQERRENISKTFSDWKKDTDEVLNEIEAFLTRLEELYKKLRGVAVLVTEDQSYSLMLRLFEGIHHVVGLPHPFLKEYSNPAQEQRAIKLKERLGKLWTRLGELMEQRQQQKVIWLISKGSSMEKFAPKKLSHVIFNSKSNAEVETFSNEDSGPYDDEIWPPYLSTGRLKILLESFQLKLGDDGQIALPSSGIGKLTPKILTRLYEKAKANDPIERLNYWVKLENKLISKDQYLYELAKELKEYDVDNRDSDKSFSEFSEFKKDIIQALTVFTFKENWAAKRAKALDMSAKGWGGQIKYIKDKLQISDDSMPSEFAMRLISLNIPLDILKQVVDGDIRPGELYRPIGKEFQDRGAIRTFAVAGGTVTKWENSTELANEKGWLNDFEIKSRHKPRSLAVYYDKKEKSSTGLAFLLEHVGKIKNGKLAIVLSPFTFDEMMTDIWENIQRNGKPINLQPILKNSGFALLPGRVNKETGFINFFGSKAEVPLGHGNVRGWSLDIITEALKQGVIFDVTRSADNPFAQQDSLQILEIIGRMSKENLAHVAVGEWRKIGKKGGVFLKLGGVNNVNDTNISKEENSRGFMPDRDGSIFSCFVNVINNAALLYAISEGIKVDGDTLITWKQVEDITTGNAKELDALKNRLEKLTENDMTKITLNFDKLLPKEFIDKREDGIGIQWEQISGMLHGYIPQAIRARQGRESIAKSKKLNLAYVAESLNEYLVLKEKDMAYDFPLFKEAIYWTQIINDRETVWGIMNQIKSVTLLQNIPLLITPARMKAVIAGLKADLKADPLKKKMERYEKYAKEKAKDCGVSLDNVMEIKDVPDLFYNQIVQDEIKIIETVNQKETGVNFEISIRQFMYLVVSEVFRQAAQEEDITNFNTYISKFPANVQAKVNKVTRWISNSSGRIIGEISELLLNSLKAISDNLENSPSLFKTAGDIAESVLPRITKLLLKAVNVLSLKIDSVPLIEELFSSIEIEKQKMKAWDLGDSMLVTRDSIIARAETFCKTYSGDQREDIRKWLFSKEQENIKPETVKNKKEFLDLYNDDTFMIQIRENLRKIIEEKYKKLSNRNILELFYDDKIYGNKVREILWKIVGKKQEDISKEKLLELWDKEKFLDKYRDDRLIEVIPAEEIKKKMLEDEFAVIFAWVALDWAPDMENINDGGWLRSHLPELREEVGKKRDWINETNTKNADSIANIIKAVLQSLGLQNNKGLVEEADWIARSLMSDIEKFFHKAVNLDGLRNVNKALLMQTGRSDEIEDNFKNRINSLLKMVVSGSLNKEALPLEVANLMHESYRTFRKNLLEPEDALQKIFEISSRFAEKNSEFEKILINNPVYKLFFNLLLSDTAYKADIKLGDFDFITDIFEKIISSNVGLNSLNRKLEFAVQLFQINIPIFQQMQMTEDVCLGCLGLDKFLSKKIENSNSSEEVKKQQKYEKNEIIRCLIEQLEFGEGILVRNSSFDLALKCINGEEGSEIIFTGDYAKAFIEILKEEEISEEIQNKLGAEEGNIIIKAEDAVFLAANFAKKYNLELMDKKVDAEKRKIEFVAIFAAIYVAPFSADETQLFLKGEKAVKSEHIIDVLDIVNKACGGQLELYKSLMDVATKAVSVFEEGLKFVLGTKQEDKEKVSIISLQKKHHEWNKKILVKNWDQIRKSIENNLPPFSGLAVLSLQRSQQDIKNDIIQGVFDKYWENIFGEQKPLDVNSLSEIWNECKNKGLSDGYSIAVLFGIISGHIDGKPEMLDRFLSEIFKKIKKPEQMKEFIRDLINGLDYTNVKFAKIDLEKMPDMLTILEKDIINLAEKRKNKKLVSGAIESLIENAKYNNFNPEKAAQMVEDIERTIIDKKIRGLYGNLGKGNTLPVLKSSLKVVLDCFRDKKTITLPIEYLRAFFEILKKDGVNKGILLDSKYILIKSDCAAELAKNFAKQNGLDLTDEKINPARAEQELAAIFTARYYAPFTSYETKMLKNKEKFVQLHHNEFMDVVLNTFKGQIKPFIDLVNALQLKAIKTAVGDLHLKAAKNKENLTEEQKLQIEHSEWNKKVIVGKTLAINEKGENKEVLGWNWIKKNIESDIYPFWGLAVLTLPEESNSSESLYNIISNSLSINGVDTRNGFLIINTETKLMINILTEVIKNISNLENAQEKETGENYVLFYDKNAFEIIFFDFFVKDTQIENMNIQEELTAKYENYIDNLLTIYSSINNNKELENLNKNIWVSSTWGFKEAIFKLVKILIRKDIMSLEKFSSLVSKNHLDFAVSMESLKITDEERQELMEGKVRATLLKNYNDYMAASNNVSMALFSTFIDHVKSKVKTRKKEAIITGVNKEVIADSLIEILDAISAEHSEKLTIGEFAKFLNYGFQKDFEFAKKDTTIDNYLSIIIEIYFKIKERLKVSANQTDNNQNKLKIIMNFQNGLEAAIIAFINNAELPQDQKDQLNNEISAKLKQDSNLATSIASVEKAAKDFTGWRCMKAWETGKKLFNQLTQSPEWKKGGKEIFYKRLEEFKKTYDLTYLTNFKLSHKKKGIFQELLNADNKNGLAYFALYATLDTAVKNEKFALAFGRESSGLKKLAAKHPGIFQEYVTDAVKNIRTTAKNASSKFYFFFNIGQGFLKKYIKILNNRKRKKGFYDYLISTMVGHYSNNIGYWLGLSDGLLTSFMNNEDSEINTIKQALDTSIKLHNFSDDVFNILYSWYPQYLDKNQYYNQDAFYNNFVYIHRPSDGSVFIYPVRESGRNFIYLLKKFRLAGIVIDVDAEKDCIFLTKEQFNQDYISKFRILFEKLNKFKDFDWIDKSVSGQFIPALAEMELRFINLVKYYNGFKIVYHYPSQKRDYNRPLFETILENIYIYSASFDQMCDYIEMINNMFEKEFGYRPHTDIINMIFTVTNLTRQEVKNEAEDNMKRIRKNLDNMQKDLVSFAKSNINILDKKSQAVFDEFIKSMREQFAETLVLYHGDNPIDKEQRFRITSKYFNRMKYAFNSYMLYFLYQKKNKKELFMNECDAAVFNDSLDKVIQDAFKKDIDNISGLSFVNESFSNNDVNDFIKNELIRKFPNYAAEINDDIAKKIVFSGLLERQKTNMSRIVSLTKNFKNLISEIKNEINLSKKKLTFDDILNTIIQKRAMKKNVYSTSASDYLATSLASVEQAAKDFTGRKGAKARETGKKLFNQVNELSKSRVEKAVRDQEKFKNSFFEARGMEGESDSEKDIIWNQYKIAMAKQLSEENEDLFRRRLEEFKNTYLNSIKLSDEERKIFEEKINSEENALAYFALYATLEVARKKEKFAIAYGNIQKVIDKHPKDFSGYVLSTVLSIRSLAKEGLSGLSKLFYYLRDTMEMHFWHNVRFWLGLAEFPLTEKPVEIKASNGQTAHVTADSLEKARQKIIQKYGEEWVIQNPAEAKKLIYELAKKRAYWRERKLFQNSVSLNEKIKAHENIINDLVDAKYSKEDVKQRSEYKAELTQQYEKAVKRVRDFAERFPMVIILIYIFSSIALPFILNLILVPDFLSLYLIFDFIFLVILVKKIYEPIESLGSIFGHWLQNTFHVWGKVDLMSGTLKDKSKKVIEESKVSLLKKELAKNKINIVSEKDMDLIYISQAERLVNIIKKNNDSKRPTYIIFATGNSVIKFYKEFVRLVIMNKLDMSNVQFYNLDEELNLDGGKNDPDSYWTYMQDNVYRPLREAGIKIDETQINFLNADARTIENGVSECDRFEEKIKGISFDYIIGGLGQTGHFAFDEPGDASNLDSKTRVIKLHDETLESFKNKKVKYGMTVGLNILKPERAPKGEKNVVIFVPQLDKLPILWKVFFGPQTTAVPSSQFRDQPNVEWAIPENLLVVMAIFKTVLDSVINQGFLAPKGLNGAWIPEFVKRNLNLFPDDISKKIPTIRNRFIGIACSNQYNEQNFVSSPEIRHAIDIANIGGKVDVVMPIPEGMKKEDFINETIRTHYKFNIGNKLFNIYTKDLLGQKGVTVYYYDNEEVNMIRQRNSKFEFHPENVFKWISEISKSDDDKSKFVAIESDMPLDPDFAKDSLFRNTVFVSSKQNAGFDVIITDKDESIYDFMWQINDVIKRKQKPFVKALPILSETIEIKEKIDEKITDNLLNEITKRHVDTIVFSVNAAVQDYLLTEPKAMDSLKIAVQRAHEKGLKVMIDYKVDDNKAFDQAFFDKFMKKIKPCLDRNANLDGIRLDISNLSQLKLALLKENNVLPKLREIIRNKRSDMLVAVINAGKDKGFFDNKFYYENNILKVVKYTLSSEDMGKIDKDEIKDSWIEIYVTDNNGGLIIAKKDQTFENFDRDWKEKIMNAKIVGLPSELISQIFKNARDSDKVINSFLDLLGNFVEMITEKRKTDPEYRFEKGRNSALSLDKLPAIDPAKAFKILAKEKTGFLSFLGKELNKEINSEKLDGLEASKIEELREIEAKGFLQGFLERMMIKNQTGNRFEKNVEHIYANAMVKANLIMFKDNATATEVVYNIQDAFEILKGKYNEYEPKRLTKYQQNLWSAAKKAVEERNAMIKSNKEPFAPEVEAKSNEAINILAELVSSMEMEQNPAMAITNLLYLFDIYAQREFKSISEKLEHEALKNLKKNMDALLSAA
ncbi:MAG: hypothetical protein NT145_08065 [Elusimicrobia bacterium]|nr:hypothetical protein [Elusimicrobiota bacterium]